MAFTKKSLVCVKIISLFIFLSSASFQVYAQEMNAPLQKSQDANSAAVRRKPVGKVQLVSFILNNGDAVTGRVESEDAFEMKLSQVKNASFISTKYHKNEIDRKTIIYKNISELDYWRNTGDYFLQKLWDFENDPDEFIQAGRCFQKARELVAEALGEDNKLVAELDEKIKKINADMENWSEQAKKRAEMRNLETLATLDAKLEKFSQQIEENSKAVADLRAELKTISSSSGNYDQLREKVGSADILIRVLEQRVTKMEGDMDSMWRWNRNQPRYYSYPKNKTDPNSMK